MVERIFVLLPLGEFKMNITSARFVAGAGGNRDSAPRQLTLQRYNAFLPKNSNGTKVLRRPYACHSAAPLVAVSGRDSQEAGIAVNR